MKILLLCTGNSCRSQMAAGILQSLDVSLKVFSAGTKPEIEENLFAIQAMSEVGIDISANSPKSVEKFLSKDWDYVITLCQKANQNCPTFVGQVKQRWHLGFEDPADAQGTDQEILEVYRKSRNEIKEAFVAFYNTQILGRHSCGCCE